MLKKKFFLIYLFSCHAIFAKRIKIINQSCHLKVCQKSECAPEPEIEEKIDNTMQNNSDEMMTNFDSIDHIDKNTLPLTSCAALPIDPALGSEEIAKIEAHYRNMLAQAKCQLDQASEQRVKAFETQMEEIAKQKINCEIAAIAAKEKTMRDMMCNELERYAQELKQIECTKLQEKAQELACRVNVEVKEAIKVPDTINN